MSLPLPLSVAIIAHNEERHIGGALDSVRGLADEVLVLLNDNTSDRSEAIAREYGARVERRPWQGFPTQRNRALALCRNDWVFFLDADERVTPELTTELRQLLSTEPAAVGYWVPRHNSFFGQILRGGGWYPDRQLRLLRRSAAHYDENVTVHEAATLQGESGQLQSHLLHLNIERLDELWQKQRAYALQEAQTLYRHGRRARWRNFVGAPAREFVRRYLQLGGWRDGAVGLLLCGTLAWFEVIKFAHLKGLECALNRQ